MRTRRLSATISLGLLLSSATLALAHTPTAPPDLPPGTLHELRITSFTSFPVAQAILQRAICGAPNTCLHNEIHLPMIINWETGEVVIDGRNPVDENGTPVPPGGPGGILFQTQSGPVEMRFAPPCENPDGCVGGEAVYFGTINQAGEVRFAHTMGFDFELFGISPISKFRAEMGTGATTDPSDPGTVAQGTPIDFATGRVVLAGIDFIPAPIIGTVLELNTLIGTIAPLPVPPASAHALLHCQSAINKAGGTYVKTAQKALQACVDGLIACEVATEAGTPIPGCESAAVDRCERGRTRISAAADGLLRTIGRGCKEIGNANVLAAEGGLAFSLGKPQCDALGESTASKDDVAACIGSALACRVEEMAGRVEPRAAEVLVANGYPQFVAPVGCVPVFPAGNATGFDGGAVADCQKAIDGRSAKYVKAKQKALAGCIEAAAECHFHSEEIELGGGPHTHDPECVSHAIDKCTTAVKKIGLAEEAKVLGMQRGCADLDATNIPALAQGLGFANLADHCASLTPPVTLTSLDDLIDCLDRSLDCSVEGVARWLAPRAAEVLQDVGVLVNGIHVLTRYPCLTASCGDGVLDVGEECDPLFDVGESCNPDCTLVVCGDGAQQGLEECDDGNTTAGDGCSPTCTDEPFACGNGVIETAGGEVCDDSDTAAGDGCNANCTSNETCGNGVVDTIRGEQCDDGGDEYIASLDGAQETPPVVTGAFGVGNLTLNGDSTLSYNVTTSGLTATAAHIHVGAIGVPGGIVFTLAGGPTTWTGTTAALTPMQVAILKGGGYYINVHTAAQANGEVRGQIGFAAQDSGDGCSDDCRSDETCGNGVIDTITGEACDDGGTANGDGCDSTCQPEACTFASSGSPLGTRTFSVDGATSKIFNSIVGLGSPVGTITTSPFSMTASATDAGGTASVTLDADVIVTVDITAGSTVQCYKFEAIGTTGALHCCGGHAVGMSFTRDSNTGGTPTTGGQSNGPAIVLAGIGTGGPGDLLMNVQLREAGGPSGTDCSTATYGTPRIVPWTTGLAAGRVVRPAQGGALFVFQTTGQPFDCADWTTENGAGTFVSADTALNAIPGLDAVNMRKLDD